MQFENSAIALDFDLAASDRLQEFDNKQKIEEIVSLAKAIAVTSGQASPDIFKDDAEGEGETGLPPEIAALLEKHRKKDGEN